MTTIDVTMTVRDADGNVIRTVEWVPGMTSETAWQCSCGVRSQEDHEEDPEPCGWCVSQGQDGTQREVEAICCSRCDELYELQYAINTHILECE